MAKKDERYYWLRLKRDFFKRHDIMIIEGMPNGKDYILFYMKLLCESIDHAGNLRFSETIPYNAQMLATITNTNIDIVKAAIDLFTQLHMMEIYDDGTLYMTQIEKLIGSETYWAKIKREEREALGEAERKALEAPEGEALDNVQLMSNVSKQEKEIEIEIEKDIDIEIDNISSRSGLEAVIPANDYAGINENQVSDDDTVTTEAKAKRKPKQQVRHKHGEYGHVMLTDEQYADLINEYGEEVTAEAIRVVDEYCERDGKRYKNYKLVITGWGADQAKKNIKKKSGQTPQKGYTNGYKNNSNSSGSDGYEDAYAAYYSDDFNH